MKTAVVVFPGSNCDRDLAVALELVTGQKPAMLWHDDAELPEGLDLITLPGGFSHGDYLRSGAIAARSPIMRAVIRAAGRGTPVLGICNGFQVLTESGLLPGALMRNAGLDLPGPTSPAKPSQSPLPTTTAISRPTQTRSTGWSNRARSLSATPGQSMVRPGASPASSTTSATCWA
jgi:hypothetical protein